VNKENKLKIELKIALIFIFLILTSLGAWWWITLVKSAKVEFLKTYFSESISVEILKQSKACGVDWLKATALVQSESEGKINAYSTKRCKGLTQIGSKVHKYSREIAKDRFKDCDPYAIDYNLWAGFNHYRGLLDYTKGDYLKAISIYNCGFGNYWNGCINEDHVVKFITNLTEFKR
jgi:soluble lytic murein transglycosylase-like protein